MAARDLSVLLKTLSDVSGLTKLGGYLQKHSLTVKGLAATYKVAGAAGKAAFSLIGAELRYLRNAAMAGAGALALAAREGAKFNIPLAQTVNMFSGNKLANFVKFRTEILNLSSSLGIGAGELTKALYTAGSAQMAPDQAFAAMRKAAQGAVADGAELNDVLAGIIAGVKSFGGNVEQTAEQLYRVVQLGQTTFGEVGQYLSQVAPVAQANKVSLGEVGGAIAQLTSKTIPLSQTVNMLRNMMSKLNMELGDGWSETRTFQEAIEEVARAAGYSQVALAKAFGLENLAGVNALIGENFAQSIQQLSEFKGELSGLSEGAQFVDQFRGWSKIWESSRNYVKEIGSEIERRWAPRLDYIANKINEMRKGEGFQNLVDTIATKLENTVTWVITQVKTASDLIEHIQKMDMSAARMATVLKTVVTEIISMAVTLFVELIKANVNVFIAIAQVVAAVFKEEILSVLDTVPGFHGRQETAAKQKFQSLSWDQQKQMAQDLGYKEGPAALAKDLMEGRASSPRILAWQSSNAVQEAVDSARGNMAASKAAVGAQWDQSAANIQAAAGAATGGTFDWKARAAANRAEVEAFTSTPAATAAAPATDPANAAIQGRINALQQEMAGLDPDKPDAGLAATAAKEQQEALAARKAAENFSMPGVSDRSFSYKQGLRKAEQIAAKEAKEADAAAAALENSMTMTLQRIQQLKEQIDQYNEQIKRLPL